MDKETYWKLIVILTALSVIGTFYYYFELQGPSIGVNDKSGLPETFYGREQRGYVYVANDGESPGDFELSLKQTSLFHFSDFNPMPHKFDEENNPGWSYSLGTNDDVKIHFDIILENEISQLSENKTFKLKYEFEGRIYSVEYERKGETLERIIPIE